MDSTAALLHRPPHTGLLRDEILFLRMLMGYNENASCSSNCVYSAGQLPNTKMKDVVFLGLDVDAIQMHEDVIQQVHIGISILDSRSLHDLATDTSTAKQGSDVIESHHFVIGSPKFGRRKSKRFLFKPFETISLSELKTKIQTLLLHRDAVLVAHGSDRELWVLESLDMDLHPLCTIDTVKAAQHPLQLFYRYSLEKLLDTLSIPFKDLHIAGNDAHFVIRALLMIAVKDAELHLEASELPPWLPTFKHIAQAPLMPPDSQR